MASRKTIDDRRARVNVILPILRQTYPHAKCSLDFTTPLELLVATILSAQCTDERVNIVTKELFKRYRSASDYANADQAELERYIQTAGFFRAKAKSIKSMAQSLVRDHQGEVPRSMEELTKLAGVGRKTANVVLGNAFGINVGVTVDTHVTRLSNRLGFTKSMDAVKIEQDLIPIVPQAEWAMWSHLLIHHGRAICKALKPACEQCVLLPHCPTGPRLIEQANKRPSRGKSKRSKGL